MKRCCGIRVVITLVSVLVWAGGCSSSSFKGSESNKAPAVTPAGGSPAVGNVNGDTGGNTGIGNSNVNGDTGVGGGATPPTSGGVPLSSLDTNGNLKDCPPTNLRVLVLDFKSGWWSGDGGDFVDRIISNGIIAKCGSTVTMEYHHLIIPDFGGISNHQLIAPGSPHLVTGNSNFQSAFADPSFASYQEIWLLSGSSADPEDIPIAHPFFQQVLANIKSSTANLFIGVGYGSISHGSALAGSLSLGADFSTLAPEGDILDPMAGVQLISSISSPALVTSNILLKDITSLADQVKVGHDTAGGDAIVDKGGIDIIAKDNRQQPTLAVTKSGRRAVLDADMPRYYASWSMNQSNDTMRLLQNILVYLAP